MQSVNRVNQPGWLRSSMGFLQKETFQWLPSVFNIEYSETTVFPV